MQIRYRQIQRRDIKGNDERGIQLQIRVIFNRNYVHESILTNNRIVMLLLRYSRHMKMMKRIKVSPTQIRDPCTCTSDRQQTHSIFQHLSLPRSSTLFTFNISVASYILNSTAKEPRRHRISSIGRYHNIIASSSSIKHPKSERIHTNRHDKE